jgi:autotransporter-associated beta strand protein
LASLGIGSSQKWVSNDGALIFSGSTIINLGNATLTLDGSARTTIAGSMIGSGGNLVKAGTGTLTLSGANSFGGATTISSGILIVQNAAALGNTLQTLSVGSGGSLQLQGGIAIGSKPLHLNGSGPTGSSGAFVNLSGSNSYAGLVSLDSDSTISSDSGSLNLSNTGVLMSNSGSSALTLGGNGNGVLASGLGATLASLTKTGEGTWMLSGSGGMAGPMVVNSGTLKLGHASALQNSTLSGGGSVAFDSSVNGHAFIVGGLGGNLAVSLQDNAATPNAVALTVGNNQASTTFGGSLAGIGSLSKTGTGTLTLAGSNSYGGVTTVSSGILTVQDANALGKTTAGTTVANGASLQIQGDVSIGAEPLTLNGSGQNGTGGAFTNLSGTNNFAGQISLASATTICSEAGLLNLTNPGTLSGSNVSLTLAGSGNGSISGIIGTLNGSTLVKKGSGTWSLGGMNTYSGATTISAGTLSVSTLGNGGVAGNLGQATSDANKLIFDGGTLQYTGSTASSDRSFTINAGKTAVIEVAANCLTLSGSSTYSPGNLSKTGAGSLVIAGKLSHSGTTTVQAGTLIVSGSLSGTTAVGVSPGASLLVSGSINSGAPLSIYGNLYCQGRVGNIVAYEGATVGTSVSASPATGNAAGLTLGSGAHLSLRIGGSSAGTGYDQLTLNGGSLTLAGDLQGSLLNGYHPAHSATTTNGHLNLDGDVFYLVIGAGSLSGQFSNLQAPAGLSGNYPTITLGGELFAVSFQASSSLGHFDTSVQGGTGHDIALMAVPEPAVTACLLVGSLLGLWRHRAKARSAKGTQGTQGTQGT